MAQLERFWKKGEEDFGEINTKEKERVISTGAIS